MGFPGSVGSWSPELAACAAAIWTSTEDVENRRPAAPSVPAPHCPAAAVNYPIRHGIVENWDNMERYWQRCIYKYLRCDRRERNRNKREMPKAHPRSQSDTGGQTDRQTDR